MGCGLHVGSLAYRVTVCARKTDILIFSIILGQNKLMGNIHFVCNPFGAPSMLLKIECVLYAILKFTWQLDNSLIALRKIWGSQKA